MQRGEMWWATLPAEAMRRVDEGLRLALGL